MLKGEKDINTIATENDIQPNLLRNWKKEFLDNAALVFDDKREENIKEKLAAERKEKAANAIDVAPLSQYPEKEVLFNAGQKMRIIDAKKVDGITKIEVEVL